jgi:hypothetical protein
LNWHVAQRSSPHYGFAEEVAFTAAAAKVPTKTRPHRGCSCNFISRRLHDTSERIFEKRYFVQEATAVFPIKNLIFSSYVLNFGVVLDAAAEVLSATYAEFAAV